MAYCFRYRALSEALYDALTDDAFYMAMVSSVAGGASQRREAMLRYYDYSMREARQYGQLYRPKGQAIGASIWSKPINEELAQQRANQKQAFLKAQLGEASLFEYLQIIEVMAEQTKTVVPPDSWYLSIVGIAPAFQGLGLGSTLIRPILDQVNALGCHTYLETFTPRNMAFYRRLGFQKAGVFDEPRTNASFWVMIRKPSLPTMMS
jgi:ribosomal protein S18 acetylase RimI-like enzyme